MPTPPNFRGAVSGILLCLTSVAPVAAAPTTGPAAALAYADGFRGPERQVSPNLRYPEAKGIPFELTEHFIPLSSKSWRPAEILADYRRRMAALPERERKRGIIVVLKTERCATKRLRACSVTSAALEKRSTPLAAEFLLYGVWIKPRDGDDPPGTLPIETGADAWKNDAAGEYGFEQGPGATIVFLDPTDGEKLVTTNAVALGLFDVEFRSHGGNTPRLHAQLEEVLAMLDRPGRSR